MSPFGARWEAAEEGGEGQGVAQGLSMPPLGCPGHLHRSRRVNLGSPQWGCRPDALNKEEAMPRLGAVWVRPAVWPAPAEGATPRSSLRDRPSPGAEMDKGCTRGRAEPELACRPRGFPGTPRRDRAEGSEGPWSKGRSWKGVTGFSVGPVCSARGSATRDTCQRPGTPRAVTEQRRACRGCHRCPDGAHRAEAGPRVGGVRGAFVGVAPWPSCCPLG